MQMFQKHQPTTCPTTNINALQQSGGCNVQLLQQSHHSTTACTKNCGHELEAVTIHTTQPPTTQQTQHQHTSDDPQALHALLDVMQSHIRSTCLQQTGFPQTTMVQSNCLAHAHLLESNCPTTTMRDNATRTVCAHTLQCTEHGAASMHLKQPVRRTLQHNKLRSKRYNDVLCEKNWRMSVA